MKLNLVGDWTLCPPACQEKVVRIHLGMIELLRQAQPRMSKRWGREAEELIKEGEELCLTGKHTNLNMTEPG